MSKPKTKPAAPRLRDKSSIKAARRTNKPARKAKSEDVASVIEAYGNTWKGVDGATAQDLRTAEAQLGATFPSELADFLLKCGGGRPTKNFFDNPSSEVFELGMGYALPDGSPSLAYSTGMPAPLALLLSVRDRGPRQPFGRGPCRSPLRRDANARGQGLHPAANSERTYRRTRVEDS